MNGMRRYYTLSTEELMIVSDSVNFHSAGISLLRGQSISTAVVSMQVYILFTEERIAQIN
jgi:hypothetical protein